MLVTRALLPKEPVKILRQEFRTEYRAEIWQNTLREAALSSSDTVLEICPGQSEKVGRALLKCGFQGRLLLVEPTRALGMAIVKRYREIMPYAQIELLPLTIRELLAKDLPPVDIVLGNHPIDDMLLGAFIARKHWSELWSETYRKPEETLRRVEYWWNKLRADPTEFDSAKRAVVGDLVALRKKLRPRNFIIYQSPSSTLGANRLQALDNVAIELLSNIREKFAAKSIRWEGAIRRIDQDPAHWLIAEKALDQSIDVVPQVVLRSGREKFLHLPAFESCVDKSCNLITDPELSTPYKKRSIARCANLDLVVPGKNARKVRTVYVDFQSDPSGIALNGDLGSGRAAYIESHFNIKGIGRTPLVKADPTSVHGTGRLSLVKGLWEMLVGNTIHRHFWCGGVPVLGLGYGRDTFELKGKSWLVTKAVREDRGTLDRPTHLFDQPLRLSRFDLVQFARDLGRLDADQYTERILHNAWSPGNVSLAGQLIDFETASAVPTRAPFYSHNARYPAVLFGLEGEGKLMTLELLRSHCKQHKKGSKEELQRAFEKTRDTHLERGVLRLLGIAGEDLLIVRRNLDAAFSEFTKLFSLYAQKISPNFQALDLLGPGGDPALFNFSKLMRFLPLLCQTGRSRAELKRIGLDLLYREISVNRVDSPKLSERSTDRLLRSLVISNDVERARCKQAAISSVDLLLDILEQIDRLSLNINPLTRALSAYRVNETRNYLMIGAMFPFVRELDRRASQGNIDARKVQELVTTLLRASDRRIIPDRTGRYSFDMRIFWEGYFERVSDQDGMVRDRFVFFSDYAKGSSEKFLVSAPYAVNELIRRSDSDCALFVKERASKLTPILGGSSDVYTRE